VNADDTMPSSRSHEERTSNGKTLSYPTSVTTRLDNGKLSSGDVECVNVGCETTESLLGSVRSNESVDLDGVNVIQLLQCLLDLSLVGPDIDNEDQGVVLLNLLHGALGVQGVDDDLVLIEAWLMGNGLAGVLRGTRELKGLGTVEGR